MHLCPSDFCGEQLPDTKLMCRASWARVPTALQRAVYAAYNHGAGLGTTQLLAAQAAAIRASRRPQQPEMTPLF